MFAITSRIFYLGPLPVQLGHLPVILVSADAAALKRDIKGYSVDIGCIKHACVHREELQLPEYMQVTPTPCVHRASHRPLYAHPNAVVGLARPNAD